MHSSQLSPSAEPPRSAPPKRVRLDYLDGVRAIAALYVCLYHALLTITWPRKPEVFVDVFEGLSALSVWAIKLFRSGHFAVSIFIVLSGYCLMLPVIRQRDGHLPGGVAKFLARRSIRILPPYYAALGVSMLLTLMIPGMRNPETGYWNQAMPMWDRDTLLSHLFLFQNWSWAWAFKIDPPVWSVATESQIYLIFAFVLLPLTRRVGVAGTAFIALWAGLEVHWYFDERYDYIYWSYVGLFALGMLGTAIGFSDAPWAKFCRERLPWGVFTLFAWVLVIRLCLWPGQMWMHRNYWSMDPMLGGATFCLLVYCTQALAAPSPGAATLILRLLQAKPLVQIGGFSYSLYLVHFPTLIVLNLILQPLAIPYPLSVWVTLSLCIPVCVPVAYLFHRFFERPFMPGDPATADQAARVAAVSPAP